MKAVTVNPGIPASGRIDEYPMPEPAPGQALVRVVEVGVDATDREIYKGLCGDPPPGADRLILGHESLGRIERAPADTAGFEEGDLVVATVRRPCPENCPNCRRGASDMCATGHYAERGIIRRDGFMTEYYAEEPGFLVKVPANLATVAVLLEPMSIVNKAIAQVFQIQQRLMWDPRIALVLGAGPIGLLATLALRQLGLETYTLDRAPADHPKASVVAAAGAVYIRGDSSLDAVAARIGRPPDLVLEATGYSPFAYAAMRLLGINGVLALIGASGDRRSVDVPADETVLHMVLGNRLVFGCVNSNRTHFERGLRELANFEAGWPELLSSIVTRRLPLAGFAEALEGEEQDGIKTVLEVAP